jgi:oxygen-independent coproporphyrinogen-3 oxidase
VTPLALYVHLPFCVRKCHYCDFNAGPATLASRQGYVQALCREIQESSWVGRAARTVFFGGGTPSELEPELMAEVVAALRSAFVVDPAAEWTLEANPGTVDPERLAAFRALGFNRISLGVQSFHDHHLAALGRIHDAAAAVATFRQAEEAGFGSRNLDLIFSLPDQTLAEWQTDLDRLVELRPEHVSLYGLTIEPETEFGRRHARGLLPSPDDDLAADMYECALDSLEAAGYAQYEISNFALPGHRCRHNQVYWRNEPYLGFGVSAASFIDGARWSNERSWHRYQEHLTLGLSVRGPAERLTGREALGEALMLGLRLRDGVNLAEMAGHYHMDPRTVFAREIDRFQSFALLEEWGGVLRLTRRGLLLANNVFAEII